MNETPAPLVSVLMANLNGARHIAGAVRAVLDQSLTDLELIVSDDGSTDESPALAAAEAGGDERFILLRSEIARTGPAAARNRALARARGRWIAIVDNDDVIEPDRLKTLIDAAERDGADIAADDMLVFYEGQARAPHGHLPAAMTGAPSWVSPAEYARSNIMFAGGAALGYLKPVFRRAGRYGPAPRYDESLRIGEDYDLVQRMLLAGGRMRLYPEKLYRYRKHAGSISHRLSLEAIEAMLAGLARLDAGGDAELAAAFARQRAALERARAFTQLVEALKARNAGAAAAAIAARPSALMLMREPIAARLGRLRRAFG